MLWNYKSLSFGVAGHTALLWPQVTDMHAQPMWETMDTLKNSNSSTWSIRPYIFSTHSLVSALVQAPLIYVTRFFYITIPVHMLFLSLYFLSLILLSKSYFKTCSSATTQHTDNISTYFSATRKPHRRELASRLWDQSACLWMPFLPARG